VGTHRSRHNKGRKPVYKDHRSVATHLIANPIYGGGWYNTRTWWTDTDKFKLDVLCEADSDIEASADALGRSPTSIAHRAKDFGLVLPQQWKRLITPRRAKQIRIREQASLLSYPFVAKVRDEHADLMAVNAIIPSNISEDMRADMCQEIMVAILEGRTTIEALRAKKANSAYFIKKFYHDNYEAGGHAISFNATDDDWDSDAVASSIAAKEWRRESYAEIGRYGDVARRTFTAPSQFEAAWKDQVGRVQLDMHQLGHFLSFDEVEEILDDNS
jgi:hypothetical protein